MLDKKEIIKANRELMELHKRVITSYLAQKSIKTKGRKKIFKLYDYYIDEDNIRNYFFRDIKLFLYAMVTDRLNEISDYFKRPKAKSKKKRN